MYAWIKLSATQTCDCGYSEFNSDRPKSNSHFQFICYISYSKWCACICSRYAFGSLAQPFKKYYKLEETFCVGWIKPLNGIKPQSKRNINTLQIQRNLTFDGTKAIMMCQCCSISTIASNMFFNWIGTCWYRFDSFAEPNQAFRICERYILRIQ